MQICIYFYEPLAVPLDELEDALDRVLSGVGQVSGTGTGISGSNVDISIADDGITDRQALALIQNALSGFPLPRSSRLVINGTEAVFSDWRVDTD